MNPFILSSFLCSIALADPVPNTFELSTRATSTLIPTSCFDSTSTLESYFDYAYPWGDTHNGAAIMLESNAVIDPAGTLTLTAVYTGPQSDDSSISYNSGTVYAKQSFTVEASGGLDFSASFIAPTVTGTWPAFWLTATSGWPPEIDMAEWKGDGKISFNTFNTSSVVATDDITYSDPGEFHSVKAELRDENGSDVSVTFYLDGTEITTQYAEGYVGQSMYLIIDLQMEGSSGSPGPTSNTTYQIKDLEIISYNP
ncbi:putative glycoside hydrolase family 16 protein [Phaeomoniella chlamydospora]|uniref:Putative glycoside hydrolase family 16 protein n=1 Tax=Phaeomoniella chlamydospora TaxID=158046 RepID=A0A0G2E7V0_PHACM|nr:putative glycoside hydrolase family 16 protein [Phaeomoniella chlamydospora]